MSEGYTIQVRVSDELKESLQKLADEDKRKLSDYVRVQLEKLVLEKEHKFRSDNKELKIGKINMQTINITARSKEHLVGRVDELTDRELNEYDILLQVNRDDCGCKFSFKTKEDIPEESLVCEHGNTIILYTDNKPTEES